MQIAIYQYVQKTKHMFTGQIVDIAAVQQQMTIVRIAQGREIAG